MNSSKGGGEELRLALYRFYDNQAERTGIAQGRRLARYIPRAVQ